MSLAVIPEKRGMSGDDFRTFQERRPDHERWELIDGVPVMMTPPFMEHNRIATNLENLLNDGLRTHDPTRAAVQRPGLEFPWSTDALKALGKQGDYKPEADVAVVDYDEVVAGARYTSVAYLLAEVVSSTDEDDTPSGRRWVDEKVELYKTHAPCEAIVLIEREAVHVTVLTRTNGTWKEQVLESLDDRLELPTTGVSCEVKVLYQDTRWCPRQSLVRTP